MKRLVTVLLCSLLICSNTWAGKVGRCRLPRGCELKGTEFSTGGKILLWYVKVLCRMPDGSYRLYLDGDLGFRLLGVLSLPDYIEMVPGDGDRLDCELP